jgi:ABC-type transport system involved in cytochrome c biogenesis permease component
MKRKLEINPVGWLEQRSWTGRLVAWGWLGLISCLYCAVLSDTVSLASGGPVHQMMAWLLGASMALSAAGSFRRERELGVLELLLVSPLDETEIILGRLRGLWAQFLPAGALLLALWCLLTSLFGFSSFHEGGLDMKLALYYAIGFLGLPVIGLYFSLACRTFLTALLATLGVGLLAAPLLAVGITWFWGLSSDGALFSTEGMPLESPLIVCQLFLTALCWQGLSVRLKRRSFPLQPAAR